MKWLFQGKTTRRGENQQLRDRRLQPSRCNDHRRRHQLFIFSSVSPGEGFEYKLEMSEEK